MTNAALVAKLEKAKEGSRMKLGQVEYLGLRRQITVLGYGDDIKWAETVSEPECATDFAKEAIWVILNSGMKNSVAQGIAIKVYVALDTGQSVTTVFGHKGKAAAIDYIWHERHRLFREFLAAEDPIEFGARLPWIGPITKYHLAKNLGADVVKPDRHLKRIADAHGTDPTTLCQCLADATGDRIGTVDYVLWRAAEQGLIDTRVLLKALEAGDG